MSKVRTYIDEMTEELTNKVSWPTWPELQSSAIVVLIATLIASLLILVMDVGFNKIMTIFYQLFQ
jgi:preprotein translocase subunit SecE